MASETIKKCNNDPETPTYLVFCPGCKKTHVFDNRWTFNDDFVFPTFRPHMLAIADGIKCHFVITDGQIYFYPDSNHLLAGKTVKMGTF